MKKSFLFLLLLISMTYSCNLLDPNGGGVITIDELGGDSDVTINVSPCHHGVDMDIADLPQAIRDYLNDRFPNAPIERVEIFQEDGTTAFGVRLNGSVEILFDLNGLVISGSDDDDERHINIADLPAAVVDYIAANFPNLTIDHAETELEFGESFIEVYLNNGIELYFDLDGNFLCRDDHGNDDNDWSDDNGNGDDHSGGDDNSSNDDIIPVTDLSPSIRDYVAQNYPNYRIDKAKKEDICNDQPVIEVELERANDRNEPDLYFDLQGNFLFVEIDINVSDLPAAVVAALETSHPGAQIIVDDVERREYPDGTVQYEVKLISGNGKVEVVLAADGTIVCVDRSGSGDDNSGDDNSGDDNSGGGNSGDDNGGGNNGGNTGTPSESIAAYIAANYPNYRAGEIKIEDLCDDRKFYKVELERENERNEPELYFDLQGNFLFVAKEIGAGDLPAAVTAALQSRYPGYRLDADKIERFDHADGSVQYSVEVEWRNDKLDVILNADGSVFCVD